MSHRISIFALIAAAALSGCAATPHSATSAENAPAVRAPRIIHGDLWIANENALDEFVTLEVVTGTLTIVGNTRLENLDGLQNLRSVGSLVITENPALQNIEGLRSLKHAKKVIITKNPRLESLQGLGGLKKVERVEVSGNGIFTTKGLSSLREVGDLVVEKNRRLLNLDGFTSIVSATNVTIVANPRLSAHNGGILTELGRVSGKLEVSRNAGLHASEIRALHSRLRPTMLVASGVER